MTRLRHGLIKIGKFYHYRIRWDGANLQGTTKCTSLQDAVAWMQANMLEYLRPSQIISTLTSDRAKGNRRYLADASACEVCGWSLPTSHPEVKPNNSTIHVHHIIKAADGGTNSEENLIALCPNHHFLAHSLIRFAEVTRKAKLIALLKAIDAHLEPSKNVS